VGAKNVPVGEIGAAALAHEEGPVAGRDLGEALAVARHN